MFLKCNQLIAKNTDKLLYKFAAITPIYEVKQLLHVCTAILL